MFQSRPLYVGLMEKKFVTLSLKMSIVSKSLRFGRCRVKGKTIKIVRGLLYNYIKYLGAKYNVIIVVRRLLLSTKL